MLHEPRLDWFRTFDMGARFSVDFEGNHDSHSRGEIDVGGSNMLGELYASPEVLLILTKRQSLPCTYCKPPSHRLFDLC